MIANCDALVTRYSSVVLRGARARQGGSRRHRRGHAAAALPDPERRHLGPPDRPRMSALPELKPAPRGVARGRGRRLPGRGLRLDREAAPREPAPPRRDGRLALPDGPARSRGARGRGRPRSSTSSARSPAARAPCSSATRARCTWTTALAAARAGAHLLVEKPLSHSLDGVAELAAEVERRGLVALVGFQYRFHPGLRRVKEWLEDGAIGEVVSARVHWGEDLAGLAPGRGLARELRRPRRPRRRRRADALPPLRLPALAARRGRSRCPPRSRAARSGSTWRTRRTCRCASPSGALATVVLDYVQRPRAHGLEIVGTRGRIRWADDGRLGLPPRRAARPRDALLPRARLLAQQHVRGRDAPLPGLPGRAARRRVHARGRSAALEIAARRAPLRAKRARRVGSEARA